MPLTIKDDHYIADDYNDHCYFEQSGELNAEFSA